MRKKYIICLLLLLLLVGCEKTKQPTLGPEENVSPTAAETEEEKELTFSALSGAYGEAFSLTLSSAKEGSIFYTTDGSDPATSSTAQEYREAIQITDRRNAENIIAAIDPLTYAVTFSEYKKGKFTSTISLPEVSDVDKATVIRAVVKYSDGSVSKEEAHTYFIGSMDEHIPGIEEAVKGYGQTLCVISLSVNYDDFFDVDSGIYMKGKRFTYAWKSYLAQHSNASAEDARKIDANYTMRGKEYEKKIYMEMLEVDENGAKTVISQTCGIRIQGNYSRSDLQKGLRLYARSDYGEGKFSYAVFGENCKNYKGDTLEKYDTLVLRAGGNTTFQAKFNDAYWQEVMKDMNVASQTTRPCLVYINGEYFGLYVLEEDYTDDYFHDHYGIPKDDVVVYKGDAEKYATGWKLDTGDLPEGVTDEAYFLKELTDFYASHWNLNKTEDYEAFCKLVDPDSVLDYFVGQIYINNKWDWPGKNWVMWRSSKSSDKSEYSDGRWRLAFLDLDFGGVMGENEASANTAKEANYKSKGLLDMNTNNPVVLMFAYLMTNKEFESSFIEALKSCTNTTFETSKLDTIMDKYVNGYQPLFDQFFKRYPGTGSTEESINGSYASAKCIRDFYNKRAGAIKTIVNWLNKNSTAK